MDERAPQASTRRGAVPPMLDVAARWSWRLLVVGAAVVVAVMALSRIRVVVIPVVVAFLVAALLSPLVGLLERWLPRLAATWAVLLGGLSALGAVGYFTAGAIAGAAGGLRRSFDDAVAELKDWAHTGPLGWSDQHVQDVADELRDTFDRVVSGWTSRPATAAMYVVEILAGVLLALALTFFFLKDGPAMWRWVVDHVRPAWRPTADRAGHAALGAVQGWLRGSALTGVFDAVAIGTGLVIMGVPAAFALSVITFFGAFIPIVGAFTAGVLASAVALGAGGLGDAVIVALIVLAVQQIEGNVMIPVVMQRQVKLHPAVVLVALSIGGTIAGILGALLAVPVTAAITSALAVVRGDGATVAPDEVEESGAEDSG